MISEVTYTSTNLHTYIRTHTHTHTHTHTDFPGKRDIKPEVKNHFFNSQLIMEPKDPLPW